MSLTVAGRLVKDLKTMINYVDDMAGITSQFCIDTQGKSGDFDVFAPKLTEVAQQHYTSLYRLQSQIDVLSSMTDDDKVLPPLPDTSHKIADDESYKALNEKILKLQTCWGKFKRSSAAGGGEDEEDMMGEGVVEDGGSRNVCPVSKRPIENPVKLLKCGHVFDRSSIDGLVAATGRRKNRIRCPYWGCKSDFAPEEVIPGNM